MPSPRANQNSLPLRDVIDGEVILSFYSAKDLKNFTSQFSLHNLKINYNGIPKRCHRKADDHLKKGCKVVLTRLSSVSTSKSKSAQSLSSKRAEQRHNPTSRLKKNNRPPTIEKGKCRFFCPECPFQTNGEKKFERHESHHQDKSAQYQCEHCSFALNHLRHLALHRKLHRRTMCNKDNNNYVNVLNAEKGTENNITAESLRNGRKLAQRTLPFSRSSLPSRPNKRRKIHHPREESDLKVAEEAHEPEEDAFCSTSIRTREEWYVSPRGNRKRYIYCGDCDYRTTSRHYFKTHAKKMHPTGLSVESSKEERTTEGTRKEWYVARCGNRRQFIYCGDCDFKTVSRRIFDAHAKKMHLLSTKVVRYPNVHHRNLNVLETSARFQEVQLEAKLKKQFGIKGCRVILHDIQIDGRKKVDR